MSPIIERPPEAMLDAHLFHPDVKSDLGKLLRITEDALAAVLPPDAAALEERAPAVQDARLADLIEDVARLFERPSAVLVDPEGGFDVRIEAAEPPQIVVGESLVRDATPQELRFHLARASMLLELGYLLVVEGKGEKRRRMLDVLIAACDPDWSGDSPVKIAPELSIAVDHIRLKLGPSRLAEAEPLASRLRGAVLELGPWMYGAVRTANRYGLLAAGDFEAAVRGLCRSDPHALGERLDRTEDRARVLERSPLSTDLVRFVISDGYILLARCGRSATSPLDRFA